MKLRSISLTNYRLIVAAEIQLETDSDATIFVGPNNSGKTSVAEALFSFLGGIRLFAVSDFSVHTYSSFVAFEAAALANADDLAAPAPDLPTLPSMRLEFHLRYDDTPEDLSVAEELLMDLDEGQSEVHFRIEMHPIEVDKLASAFKEIRSKGQTFTLLEYLGTNLSRYFGISYYKVARDGAAVLIAPDKARNLIKRLIHVDFLPAQRHMEDQEESQQATKLSRLLNVHYERRYKISQPAGYEALEVAVREQAEDLTVRYADAFAELKEALQTFGYPGTPDINIRAELSAAGIFKNNTRIFYTGMREVEENGAPQQFELPERYNGLGFKNLIYMVLQLKAFRDDASNLDDGPRPRVHLVIVEEPEAHLHPQMQTVFLHKAQSFLKCGETDGSQLIITTHSSHIAASSGLTPVRYFRAKGQRAVVKDLMAYKNSLTNQPERDAYEFVAKYLTVTRCDLFFCDKAILIEGAVERLLLPRMLKREGLGGYDLTQTYLSIVEVGGAYAHIFRDFIAFLEVPTLIVTDLDSVDASRKRTSVADGVSTSNATLKLWRPGKTALAEIRAATPAERTDGLAQVVFQIPEATGARCGRTFEEAFCYANADWLIQNKAALLATGHLFDQNNAEDLTNCAFDIEFPKVDFAIDLMLKSGWAVPKYIAEGLLWLSEVRA